LHTPVTTLLDIGTEYGTEVDSQGTTKVFVFDGEVSVVPRGDAIDGLQPEQLTVGQASRFDKAGSKPVEFASARFKRQVPDSELPTLKQRDTLLAYEGFDYSIQLLGNADGGVGWGNPWSNWYGNQEPSVSQLRSDEALGHGPCLEVFGKNKVSWRRLETPIRLDEDGVYYFSFLLKKTSRLPRGKSQFGAIEFRTADFPTDNWKLAFGMNSEDYLHMSHNKQQVQSAPPIPFDQTVRIVAKIVASKHSPDQVMVRWYGADEVIDSTEPHIWSSTSRPANGNAVFEKMAIRVGGDVSYLVDELRLGTSWSAVSESLPAITPSSSNSSAAGL